MNKQVEICIPVYWTAFPMHMVNMHVFDDLRPILGKLKAFGGQESSPHNFFEWYSKFGEFTDNALYGHQLDNSLSSKTIGFGFTYEDFKKWFNLEDELFNTQYHFLIGNRYMNLQKKIVTPLFPEPINGAIFFDRSL